MTTSNTPKVTEYQDGSTGIRYVAVDFHGWGPYPVAHAPEAGSRWDSCRALEDARRQLSAALDIVKDRIRVEEKRVWAQATEEWSEWADERGYGVAGGGSTSCSSSSPRGPCSTRDLAQSAPKR